MTGSMKGSHSEPHTETHRNKSSPGDNLIPALGSFTLSHGGLGGISELLSAELFGSKVLHPSVRPSVLLPAAVWPSPTSKGHSV